MESRTGSWLFSLNFFRHPLRNASITPSSKYAAKAMIEGIDFSKIRTVVELGPGIGVFTEEVLKKCLPGTTVLLVELEISYIDILQKRFGNRVIIENCGAQLLDQILARRGIGHVDLVISGLPFLPEEQKKTLVACIKGLTERGTIFRMFTYMPSVMKRVYEGLVLNKISFVWRNFPPLWVFGIN